MWWINGAKRRERDGGEGVGAPGGARRSTSRRAEPYLLRLRRGLALRWNGAHRERGYVVTGCGLCVLCVPEAIKKASKQAKKNLIRVPITADAKSIPHEVMGKFGSGKVLLKPAVDGTGVIASATVRGILEAAGIQNVRTKTLRSRNPHNVVKATLNGLMQLRDFDKIAAVRGKSLAEIL